MKNVFLALCIMFLTSCVTSENFGYYTAVESSYMREREGRTPPQIVLPSVVTGSPPIIVSFPQTVGIIYGFVFSIIFPIPLPEYIGPQLDEDEKKLTLFWHNAQNYNRDFIDGVTFYLKLKDGDIKIGKKVYLGSDGHPTSGFPIHVEYFFYTSAKEIGQEGILVMKFKDLMKEIPFKYERKWYIEMSGAN